MNKTYIKVALALLSLAGYMQNVIFASETSADVATTDSPPKKRTHIKNALYQDANGQTYLDRDEVLLSLEQAKQTSKFLQKLSENGVNGYSVFSTENKKCIIYSKINGNIDIGRLHVTISPGFKYHPLIWSIWDFDDYHTSNSKFLNGIVARGYWRDLCLFEKQSVDPNYTPPIKKYALGGSFNISHNITVILCPSRIINNNFEINQETDMKEVYSNVKPFDTDIDPEDALAKLGANVSGFVIERDFNSQVHITYINAIYDDGNSAEVANNKIERDITYQKIIRLIHHLLSTD
ncbi:fam-a protein [Plasmodium chabaudi adami]|uniref:Fam-a protein n=1 Tax=Plasmodium chabaudi adami TaxID=5826 RepID=A0A1D3LAT1_PLACE|nr:fam-a protein [Plasmodium chabaudi adami]